MNTESIPSVSLEEIRALLEEAPSAATAAGPLPLSSAQQRLWFLDQLEPGSARYNIPAVFWLKGSLNIPALERAVRAVIARHEALRARFLNNEGEPEQIIGSEDEFELSRQDLQAVPSAERDALAKALIEEEVCRPFNLSHELPIRMKLLELNALEHVLIISMHHIVSDEWSFKIFYREVEAAYTTFLRGAVPDLPELPIQYADYAAWQKDWLESDECRRELQFWKAHLAGNPLPVNLPADRPRSASSDPRGAIEFRRLPPGFCSEIHQLAARTRLTPFMVLLAGCKALLHRCTAQSDIIVGTPMACRNQVETENVVGYFANTLPLRTRVSGEMTFAQLMSSVRDGVLDAYSNQNLPFDMLVDALQPQRAAGQTPFISVLFLFQNGLEFLNLPDLQVTFLDAGTNTAKFDLTFFISDDEEGLALGVEYNAELFDSRTMAVLLWNYEKLLRAMAADRDQRISESSLEFGPQIEPPPGWTPPPKTAPSWEFFEPWFESRQKQNSPSLNEVLSALKVHAADGVPPQIEPETLAALQSALDEMQESRESSIIEIQPEGSQPPLFLVHGAGGGMFWGYSNLARHLGMDQPVYGFKSRGLDGKEELESIEALARAYIADLRSVQPHGPYRLGGYCFGGVVAFEMARQLESEGEVTEYLCLFNSSLPNSSYTEFSWTPRSAVLFGLNVLGRVYYSARAHPTKIPGFIYWKFRSLLKPRSRTRATTSAGAANDGKDVNSWVDLSAYNEAERRVWQRHYIAACNYRPQPYSGRVWLFRSPTHLLHCSFERHYGWKNFARGGVVIKIIHSAHEAILEEPAVRSLAAAMDLPV